MNSATKLILFSFLCFFFYSETRVNAQTQKAPTREEFNKFLLTHPFLQRERMTKEELKKIPKKDRPDLAWELDYLTTLDPSTGKPERTRLFPTLQLVDQFTSSLTPATPGSSASSAWAERGPNNVAGRTRALMWDPNDITVKKVWAGGVTGGLWYNNDITSASSQWQSVNDFWDNIAVTCIAYDPNNTNTFYVGTGEGYGSTSTSRGAGIWKSTDGGTSWSQLTSTTNFYFVNDIVVRDENGTSVVYAAVDGNFYNGTWHGAAQSGLQRSTNGGSSWTQVLPTIPSNTPNFVASDIEIGPDNRIWIGTRRTPYGANDRGGGRVLYSDNGTSWTISNSSTVANGSGRVEVAVAPSDSATVYALVENNGQVHEIIKTTNHGTSWTSLSEPVDDDLGIPSGDFSRGQAWYDLIAAVDPNDPNKVVVGAINAHMSTNGGTTWSQISKWSNNPNMGTQPYSYVHADHHNMLFKPGSSSEFIIGTDGGVSWTNNLDSATLSAVFSNRNNGYNVTQFYAGGIHPSAGSNIMVGGTQDNGSQRYSTTGMNSTTEISGGDGAYCFIDQTNGMDVITSYVYNNYYHFNSSGTNYVKKFMSNSNTGLFINPADLDDANNILYSTARTGQLYKVSNYHLSSYSVDSFTVTGLTNYATAIKVSPYNNSANVYAGDMSGNLVKINNANGSSPTFTNLTDNAFPTGAISSIEFGSSENEIIVTFKNYGVTSIFYSTDGGSTWVGKEGNLPDMPVRWALMHPTNNNEVILATEVGIWSTTNFQNSSPSWSPSNSGLANVRVDMLQFRSADNTVMAITHGRGIFTSNAWNQSTPGLPYRRIADIKGVDANGVPDSLNLQCQIQGVVTSIDFDGNTGYNYFLQDSTGGIYIYSSTDVDNYVVNMGDELWMEGTIIQWNGLTEFEVDSIVVLSSNNPVPSPQSVFGLSEATEGNLIALNFCELVNPSAWPTTAGSHNVPIVAGNGDTVIMRLDFDANLIPSLQAPVGPFTVIGCQGQFDQTSPYFDGRQILPRFVTDVYSAAKVRFSVDMSNEVVSTNGVHIAGNFGTGNPNLPTWNPGGIQLIDSSNTGVYETVLTLSLGYYEYKFINDNTWANGNDEVIVGCNAPNTTNRFIHVNADTTLPSFCFESCIECPKGDTLYSFDFANGLPSGWTNAGDTSTALWEYRGPNTTPSNTVGSRGAFNGLRGPITSSTTSNGFMIFDSDYLDDPFGASGNGVSPAPHIGAITTQTLNFSSEQNVILQFESYFRTYESAAGIAISTNGGVSYTDTIYVHTNLAPNQATGTADLVRLDLSNYVGGQSNVKIAFVFDGTNPLGINGGQFQRGYYFWMLDDIEFLRTPAHDLNLTDAYYTVGNFLGRYGKMPANLTPPVTFWGEMVNEGTAAQTGVKVDFNSTNFNFSSNQNFLSPDSTLLVSSTTNLFPTQTGTYSFVASASADSADAYNQNNSRSLGFEVSDSTISLGTGIGNQFFGTNSWPNASDTFIVANVIELTDSVEVNSVGVQLSALSTPGAQIWIRFWDYNATIRGAGGSFQTPQTPQSSLYTLTAADIANQYVQIPIQGTGNSKKLLPGTYYVGAVLFGNNNADTVRVGSDNSTFQPFDAAVIYIPYSSGFGGVYTNGNAFNLDVNVSPINPTTLPPLPQANGDTLYKYDFNNGLPTGWTNIGDTSTALWEYRGPNTTPSNTVGSRGAFNGTRGPIQSKTTGNGFMIFDSDYLDDPFWNAGTGASPAPHVGVLTTEALNFSQDQEVVIEFESYFRNYASGAGLAFSYDGGTTFPDTVYLHTNLAPNQQTSPNELVRFDASSYIGGKPNVKIAFVFDGTNPLGFNTGGLSGYYFWMIDDIAILKKPGNDLVPYEVRLAQPNTIGEHSAVPQFLAQPWEMSGRVINKGQNTATSVRLFAETSTGSASFVPNYLSGSVNSLPSGDTSATLNFLNFGFNNLDTYQFAFRPSSDSVDAFTAEDTIHREVSITPREYRLHRIVWSRAYGTPSFPAFGSADSFVVANQFPITQRTVIDTMVVNIGSASRVGGELIPVVFGNSTQGYTPIFQGSPYQLTATDTANFNAIIPVNHVLDTGVYYIGFMLNSNGGANHVTVIDDESYIQNSGAAQIRLGGVWYSNGNAFHINLRVSQAPPGLPYRTLAELTTENANGVADSNGVTCATAGIVASLNYSANGAPGPDVSFAVINSSNTAGITAISFDPTTTLGYTPQIGDSVYMYGTVNQFNGLTQFDLDSIEVKSTGNILPTESFLTSLGENEESRLIRLDNVALVTPSQWPAVGSDANVDIEYNGTTYTMRVDRHTNVAQNLSAPTGRFNVIGIGGQFDNSSPYNTGYQILPRFASDITPLYAVTFQVDMANEVVDPAGPHVAGEFRDHDGDGYPENYTNAQWFSAGNPMTQDPNNPTVYSTTIYVQSDSLEYKFLNGSQWGQDEQLVVGSSCTKTTGQFTNRISTITSDTTLGVVCFASCNNCKSQLDLPITWDDTATVNYDVVDFNGTASSFVADPSDPSNIVLRTDKSPGGQPWQGTVLGNSGLANPIPFGPGATTMTAVVYSPDAGIPVRLKVESDTNATISAEVEALTTVSNAWDTLVFDFANSIVGTLNFNNTYNKVVIFYDFLTNPTATKTYYVDSIDFGGTYVPPCFDDTTSSQVTICNGDTATIFGNSETTAGFYYQTYTTFFGCDSVIEVELVVNPVPSIDSVSVTQLSGCGTNDGALNISVTGGTSPLTYSLSTGQSQSGNGSFTGLFPANYLVTVTDANGCSEQSGPHVINSFAGSPALPTITGPTTFQYCQGDSILSVQASGGAGTLYWYDDAALTSPIDSGGTFTPPSVTGFNVYYVAETISGCQGPPAQVFVTVNSIPATPVITASGFTFCETDSILPIFAQGIGVEWYSDSALTSFLTSGVQLNVNPLVSVGSNSFYATASTNGCTSPAASIGLTVLPSPAPPSGTSASYCDNDSPVSLAASLTGTNTARWYSDSNLTSLVSVNPSFTPSSTVGTSTFYLTQFDGICESEAIALTSTVFSAPVVNSVTTNNVSVCGATDGSLTINAVVSNPGPQYSIDNGSTFQSSPSFNNLAASGYIIVVEDSFCSTLHGIETISAPGAPQAPFVFGADTLCNGDSIPSLGATAQGSGSLTWYDSPLLGASNQVATGIVFTPTTLGIGANTYYVTETSGGCEGAASAISLFVNPIPGVFAGVDQSICIGSTATLVASGANTYVWAGTVSNDSLVISPQMDTTLVVEGTSTGGCSATDTVTVFVNALPTVSAANLPTLCDNQGNFLLPTGTPVSGLYLGDFVSNNTFLTDSSGAGTFNLVYSFTDNNGCSNTDSTTLTVNASPTVTLANQANVCANASAVTLVGGIPGGGSYSGNSVSGGSFDPTNSGPGTFSIFYSYTDLNGCTSSDTASIMVDTVPTISWNGFPVICELDGPYSLVEATPAGGIYSGTGVTGSTFDPAAAGGAGTYAISYDFTDGNGCAATSSQNLSVSANPDVNLGPDTTLCNNNPTITLDAGAGASFDWTIGGTSVGTNQTFDADSASSGTIIVVVTSSDGCTGSDTIVVDYESICVGMEDQHVFTENVRVFPNPSQGQLSIEVSLLNDRRVDLAILSTNGQVVFEKEYQDQTFIKENLELGHLASGVYYLQLKSNDLVEQYRIILQ